MVNFQTYQPPGVYVEGTADTLVAPGGAPATTVTLVGPARGYQLATETLGLNTTAVALKKKGVLPDAHESPNLKVTKLDGTVLAETTDYALVRGSGSGDSTTIRRVNTSTAIANNDAVIVSYSYADTTYYSPKTFEDFSSVESVYGPAMVSALPTNPDDTQVSSPLSLAARVAFENGAGTVLCVAIEPTTTEINLTTRFNEAYNRISNNPEVTLLVPVFAQAAGQTASAYSNALGGLISAVRAHCVASADQGLGRIAFVGADTIYDDEVASFDEIAANAHSSRVVLAYPNRLTVFNASLNQSTEIGGPYLAAAYAGRLAAQAPNRGITRLQVFGFSGIPEEVSQEMTNIFKNTLSASGVAVTETGRTSRLQVRHGVSTDTTDILTSEVSITRSQDVLYRLVADGIENAALIGEPIDLEMTIRVKGVLTGILESAVQDLVVAEWLNLQVRQQTTDTGNPTIIECQFAYRPYLPLNYITVTFSMDLTSGEITTDISDVAA